VKRTFLGIGTNLGNREDNLKNALAMIGEYIGTVRKTSSVYETEPWGFRSENEFLNMVAEVETDLPPSGVLGRILMIEAHSGRIRNSKEYSSRVIDLDILFYDDLVLNEKSLVIPHPKIPDRRFVLVPLFEVAPDLIHPVLKKSIRRLLKECKDKSRVKKYKI